MKQMKKYLKMISPFNDVKEMPMVVYICKKMLAFFIIYFASAILGEAIIIGGLSAMGYDPLHGIMPTGNIATLMQYYGFSIFLVLTLIYSKFVEKRTIKSMGFNKRILDYIIGATIAIVLLVVIMGVCCITGGISYVGIGKNIDYAYIFALLVGLMIQGAAEEILCRGFLMSSLLKKTSVPLAIIFSSTAFAWPHFSSLLETGDKFAIIGIINLYLVSVVFSLLVLQRANIWISCGLHTVWNFLLCGIFGLVLSGSEANTAGIICFKVNGTNTLNGGAYGIESSILTTAVLSVVVVILARQWSKGKNKEDKNGI